MASLPTTNKIPPPSEASSKARGANRSTKAAHKLKVLPEQPEPEPDASAPARIDEEDEDGDDEEATGTPSDAGDDDNDEEDAEPYRQLAQIPAGTARRDALRLTKKEKAKLPRVTAYCTATSYRLPELMRFFNARRSSHHTSPQLFDEVIYTPYSFDGPERSAENSKSAVGDLLGLPDLAPDATTPSFGEADDLHSSTQDLDNAAETETIRQTPRKRMKRKTRFDRGGVEDESPEVFLFDYGTVVFWGMTEAQEKRLLSSIRRFEVDKLGPDEIEMENLNYYYASYSRIYNDVITLRKGSKYMTKLSLSHALAQSVKISLFEELISTTIENTKDVPEIISETGKINMHHSEIMRQIGELFILRMNINLVGSVLDSPELFWTYPDLQPLYEAARDYLEITQRVDLLNARVEVLQDMLGLLKESVQSKHAERLEQIVIALIVIEIVLGVITILVDLFSV